MHHSTDRIAFVTPVVEHWLKLEIAPPPPPPSYHGAITWTQKSLVQNAKMVLSPSVIHCFVVCGGYFICVVFCWLVFLLFACVLLFVCCFVGVFVLFLLLLIINTWNLQRYIVKGCKKHKPKTHRRTVKKNNKQTQLKRKKIYFCFCC